MAKIAVDSILGIQRLKRSKRVKWLKLWLIVSWASNGDDSHMIACDLLQLSWKCIGFQWFLMVKAGVDSILNMKRLKRIKRIKCYKKALKHALLLLLRLRWWCAIICIWTVAMIMKCMGSSWNCMWFASVIMELHRCSLILSGLDKFWWVDGSEND